jgi:hypothetical protein
MANDTSLDWAENICFSKTAAVAACTMNQTHTGDLALVLNWIYYLDVISKFSIRHFDRRQAGSIVCAKREHLMVAAKNSPDMTNVRSPQSVLNRC